jgi:SulP family sulfate permease
MAGERRATNWLVSVATGLIIGAVESMLAIAFAALVFGGLLAARLPDGIGLYLGAAALILGFLAWRGGTRGVVGSVQDAPAAVLALVASVAAKKAVDLDHIARQSGLKNYERPDVFLTVIAATILVTLLCGVVFLVIGRYRLGGLIRFVPYPVVGGFLAGTGWLLFKSGINASTGSLLHLRTALAMIREYQIVHWVPALAFGVILLVSVRVVKRPLVIPAVIAIGFVVFVAGMVATGSSIEEVRQGGWLLFGPSDTPQPWHPWTLEAITGADWLSVLALWGRIGAAVFVATMAALFNINGSELVLDRDLDTNREMRDAGVLNVVSGALGGIPGYHALSLTALAARMRVDARAAGMIAALVPLAAVVFGGSVVGLIPKMIVGGVLVFLGLSFIVEWVWDKRRLLPRREYAVVLVILLGIMVWGFLWGVVIGLVLAVMLFVISYGRIELVREVAFGETYRSNVDRPADERAELRGLSARVQILRASGFVFFGSTNRLLERIRARLEDTPLRFLVVDLRRVTGVDSSAVVSFVKVMRLAEASGFEVVFTGASDAVRAQLAQGGVAESDELVSFEPDLDRGLQRCEDALLGASGRAEARAHHPAGRGLDPLPPGLAAHLERVSVPAGTVLLHQDEPPGDIYVLESGRLGVETVTPEGARIRLRTLRPGVVVGEIALYAGVARTADVVAETLSVVLRLSRESIERLETEEPALAAALHRWLATTLAERLSDTRGALEALLD